MTLHHLSCGEGVPVLAVHGWTPDHRLMSGCLEPVFTDLPGYRRIYPDLPGMGRSPAGSIDSSDGMLDALLSFVDDEIGTEPFLLLGESYGGYLARGLVARRPEQVLGLGLICPIGVAVEHAERTVPDHVVLRSDASLLDGLTEQVAADFTEITVVQTAETLRAFLDDVLPGLELADTEAMGRIRQNWTLTTPPESGPAYERPTLILCGRQDSSTGYEDQWPLLPHYPRATYAVLDAAGHNLQIEQPELFAVLLRDWLRRVSLESTSR
ncbi:alpha/beta hydrolase fold protein [Kribbella flavida DSM 17836]|uniref:Alpha/beta hydrolase fold protein n=1 Tax=Kribbella flavida (strain DSM 17836 / JCM 10339 / NBRC 14399) TaxID=479435 RepID=D2PMZ6_KRIFD|nr:alpha/beta hydrolase [Kribbella flavida]ADB32698.1 alpha/beta hydrolase fold protein [Kribbella flavida DSM 17836]